MSSRNRLLSVVLAASLMLAGCGGDPADAEDLVVALTEIAELSTEDAQCVADDITENSDYSELFPDDDEPPSIEDVLADVADGESETEGLVAAFEQDVAEAVTVCTSPQ